MLTSLTVLPMPKIIVIIAKMYCLLVLIAKHFFLGVLYLRYSTQKSMKREFYHHTVRGNETEDEKLIGPSVLEMHIVCVLNRNRCY